MNRRRWLRPLALAACGCVAVAVAAPAARGQSAPPNFQPLETKAAQVFSPAAFTGEESELKGAADGVQLGSQLIAAAIIIGGLWVKLRDEARQMEGIAIMLLKVGFIATIPAWQTRFVTATDSLAGAIGYASATGEEGSPVLEDYWGLLRQWAPGGSPAIDALDAQTVNEPPPSGSEAAWSLEAWHWARGVGVADASLFHGLWQAASGGIRAFVVFASCAAMACAVSFVIAVTYLAELLRYLLLAGGVALLPIFVAGVGVESLRTHSLRAILGIATVVAWPIGWALASIVSHAIAAGAQGWMADVAKTSLANLSLPAAPFSVAAPYLAWGAIFFFVGITLALCVWQIGALYYVPVLLGRLFAAAAASRGFGLLPRVCGETLAGPIGPRSADGSAFRGSAGLGRVAGEAVVTASDRLTPPRRPPPSRRY